MSQKYDNGNPPLGKKLSPMCTRLWQLQIVVLAVLSPGNTSKECFNKKPFLFTNLGQLFCRDAKFGQTKKRKRFSNDHTVEVKLFHQNFKDTFWCWLFSLLTLLTWQSTTLTCSLSGLSVAYIPCVQYETKNYSFWDISSKVANMRFISSSVKHNIVVYESDITD